MSELWQLSALEIAAAIRSGTTVGVQVIGDRFTDLRCLAIAEQIQGAEGVHTPIQPVLD
ncbi:MAG TPA: hypothetical protein VMM60_09955 [Ilumatobacter sp.]|nr:hypothetical protein [Ilumatobacter sp.]